MIGFRPMPARPFELLVFDWDGTLMDSVGTIVACTRAAMRDLGLGEPPEEAIRGTIGLGLREAIDSLFPECDPDLYQRVVECYRVHWRATYRDQPLLFPRVDEMLAGLAAEGYLLAIATGKSRRGLDDALERGGLAALFHATRTADEAPSKPHPQMLLDILGDLGVPPAEALMIGDTVYDLGMARSARTPSLAVLSGTQLRHELEPFGPLAYLDRVGDLPEWLAARSATLAPSAL